MTARCTLIAILAMSAGYFCMPANSSAADLMSEDSLNRLGAQQYWQAELPLPAGETVVRTALLDDNLYAITSENHVFAIHAATGIIRWSNLVDDPGQVIRGPSHNDRYAFFTTSCGVRLFDRRTGELAGEPRTLRGVIIESIGDRATISIGQLHGVRRDDVFRVYRKERPNDPDGVTIAQLKITAVDWRQAKGRLTRVDSSLRTESGDQIQADVILPLEEVKIKYPPTSAVVADGANIYVGTSNQRFFSYNILLGHERWRFSTPRTVTAKPVIYDENLYIGGQDGRVISCSKLKEKNWIFQTQDAIFADLVVNDRYVYVASGDRSVYCLNRLTGDQVWRERFNTELEDAPVIIGERLYQRVPAEGLYVMNAETGKLLWHREEGGRCLGEFGGDVYLLTDREPYQLVRADAFTGKVEATADAGMASFADASPEDASILLTSREGKMVCLRSQHAPRLRPEQIAEVLRNDQLLRVKQQAIVAAEAGQKDKVLTTTTEVRKKDWKVLFAEEDWLASRNTAKPAGGYGHVTLGGEDQVTREPEEAVEVEKEVVTEPEDDGVWTFEDDEDDDDGAAAADDDAGDDEEDEDEDE